MSIFLSISTHRVNRPRSGVKRGARRDTLKWNKKRFYLNQLAMLDDVRKAALEYHRLPVPGKIEVAATKSLITQRDLALAYTPGVAAVCDAIVENPGSARELTARGNLVAVVTNGTAGPGLGHTAPLPPPPRRQ